MDGMADPSDSPFERIEQAAEHVRRMLGATPKPAAALVLGSGLSPLVQEIETTIEIPYAEIPSMPQPRVVGHEGRLLVGRLKGVPVACLSGRAHLYEGYSPESAVFGVRLLAALGAPRVIVTNAAGGITEDCAPGTLMLISDHVNLTGKNPLLGPNEDRWGPRFPDMSEAYSKHLRQVAADLALKMGIPVTEGVYAGLLGPTYETPAEIRMLETLGANAVGMSTVLETIVLRHQGIEVLGISCITNKAAGKSESLLSHDEVAKVAGRASADFVRLVSEVIATVAQQAPTGPTRS